MLHACGGHVNCTMPFMAPSCIVRPRSATLCIAPHAAAPPPSSCPPTHLALAARFPQPPQGSGWGWLGYNKASGKLEISTLANQDPLSITVGGVGV